MTAVCFCGHVDDEHDDDGPCTIEECLCVYFEEGETEGDE